LHIFSLFNLGFIQLWKDMENIKEK
jgi:hypothetical protein